MRLVVDLGDDGCLRTSAARAAADFGSFPPASTLEPSVRPPVGVGVYNCFFGAGTEVRALIDVPAGAGALLSGRPSPWNFLDSLPKQLPIF